MWSLDRWIFFWPKKPWEASERVSSRTDTLVHNLGNPRNLKNLVIFLPFLSIEASILPKRVVTENNANLRFTNLVLLPNHHCFHPLHPSLSCNPCILHPGPPICHLLRHCLHPFWPCLHFVSPGQSILKLLQTFLLINSLTPKWYVSHLFLFLYKYIKIVLVIPNVRESNRQTWCSS